MNEALANLDLEPIIDQIAGGALMAEVAKSIGVDKRRLSEKLRQHPEYQLAKELGAELNLDAAQLALRDPASDIARAREEFRAAAWRAEREHPARWGRGPEIVINQLNLGDMQAVPVADLLKTVVSKQQSVEVNQLPENEPIETENGDANQ